MLFKSILVLLFISINTHCYGQSLSINTTGDQADPKAMLDIKSFNKGILIPRINLIDTSNPISGAKPIGLLVWNENTGFDKGTGFYFWTGIKWHPVTIIYKAGNNISIDSATNTINALVQINTVILDGIVPAPTASKRFAKYSTDFKGNPGWRKENKTIYYIESFY